MNHSSNSNGEKLGILIGKMDGLLARLDIVHEDVAEIKSDLKDHTKKDERYYEMIHSLDGNQKKVMGLAAGVALVVGVGIDRVKQIFGWG